MAFLKAESKWCVKKKTLCSSLLLTLYFSWLTKTQGRIHGKREEYTHASVTDSMGDCVAGHSRIHLQSLGNIRYTATAIDPPAIYAVCKRSVSIHLIIRSFHSLRQQRIKGRKKKEKRTKFFSRFSSFLSLIISWCCKHFCFMCYTDKQSPFLPWQTREPSRFPCIAPS